LKQAQSEILQTGKAAVITVALWCCCKVAGDADERDDKMKQPTSKKAENALEEIGRET
jgi:hypothetical protein